MKSSDIVQLYLSSEIVRLVLFKTILYIIHLIVLCDKLFLKIKKKGGGGVAVANWLANL